MEPKFDAPWALSLKLMTGMSVAILLCIMTIGLFSGAGGGIAWLISMVVIPLLFLVVAVFFVIRGYVITPQRLLVQRLGWHSELILKNLVSAECDPEAMKRSIRVFGNGGFFCFAGKFRNKRLGVYRAFATAPHLAVVLRFTDRMVVVTPDNPEEFVKALKNPEFQGGAT
jgi:hypothetical protein